VLPWSHWDASGAALAALSGGLTSGIGYLVWYAALRGLSSTHAAVVQLSVPILIAVGGITFLGESVSVRFVFASTVTMGGIALVILERAQRRSLKSI
jgi:drug/metabolite transporter (DMT)-like permease